MLDIFTESNRL